VSLKEVSANKPIIDAARKLQRQEVAVMLYEELLSRPGVPAVVMVQESTGRAYPDTMPLCMVLNIEVTVDWSEIL
jgi:hypothetical protein